MDEDFDKEFSTEIKNINFTEIQLNFKLLISKIEADQKLIEFKNIIQKEWPKIKRDCPLVCLSKIE